MSFRLRKPWEHPWKGPFLKAWAGHYDHAFVALHPFCRTRETPWVGYLRWAEVARACGSPFFAEFALALWDASYYDTGADKELVRRIEDVLERMDLFPPSDSNLNGALIPEFCQIFRAIGLDHVRVRSDLHNAEEEVALSKIEADPWAVNTDRSPQTSAMIDPEYRLIITTQASSDWQWSVIGMKSEARVAVEDVFSLEGFWAGPDTGPVWIDEPGTYSYPDWLREATDAA